MKLITDQTNLEKEFLRLTKKYQSFYWATAWAGINSKPFEDLKTKEHKIKKVVVGIHFYQTHPDFIQRFLKNKNVHYILQPEGTFHPKIYLFTNSESDWELLVGSGNFTNGAFITNREATVLLSCKDDTSKEIYGQAKRFIEQAWIEGKTFTDKELEKYRTTWKNQRPKINSLSGRYGSAKRKSKPIHEVAIINKTWTEFIAQVVNEVDHGVERRLRVIQIAHNLFTSVQHFDQLQDEERKFIAGIPNKLNIEGAVDWGYFGSMKGAGIFKNKILTNAPNISKALDQIPLAGQITRKHYESFIRYYHQIFLDTRLETANNLATASRLLAMKRPDIFVCYDVENKANLSKDFGIVQTDMNYDRYWDDIIERIYDSEWWRNPEPINETQRKVSEARAAFLDSLYYER
jgi:hypothetical protein